jgi:type IV secretory pathway VirD2 relaxase
MINESALRETLVSLAEDCKSMCEQQISLQVEVAALRETVRALDPTFSDNFEARKKAAKGKVSELFAHALEVYDVLIERLKGGDIC